MTVASLADALRDRYLLERELGRGGMATVYLAHDVKHDRPVALKVLHPELAATLGPERFQREIRLAARLQHPHILTVLDSGEAAGQLWFTMPYVEGESLRDRLEREHQLSVEDAVRIGREAALALEYAHQHGVIHRDIKPENLLLTKDGSTLVADFGIARALVAGEAELTGTGMTMGTPAYMSPEQAAGERNLDARTDLYALATVLYEILAGEPPYTGPTAQAIVAKRFADPVPSVRRIRPVVPEAVDAAIQRALAPVPADRFGTAAQFAQALQPIAPTTVSTTAASSSLPAAPAARASRFPIGAITLGVAFLIGLGLLFVWRRGHGGSVSGSGGPKVLAVLPFENLGDSADAYFADGVTDEVRSKLSRIGGMEVIARGSSNEYRHSRKPAQQIARELGADYLLTATVRWEKAPGRSSRVRVIPELVDAGPGHSPRTKWEQPFDAALTDVFQVQGEIAGKVAGALDIAMGDSVRRRLAAKPTRDLAAYDAFLKGEEIAAGLALSAPSVLHQAIGYYQQAVTLDPTFVLAWLRLTRAHAGLYNNSVPTVAEADAVQEAARRVVALAPAGGEGHLALGVYYAAVLKDPARALAEYEQALKVAPHDAELLRVVANSEEALGHWESGVERKRQAQALDPRSVGIATSLGFDLLWLRRYPQALATIDRALALDPTNPGAIEAKAMISLAQGELSGAQAVIRAAPRDVDSIALAAYIATYWDLFWVLDDHQQRVVLNLGPESFDNDRGAWGITRAEIYRLRGDRAKARVYADSARQAFEEQLKAVPDDAQEHVLLGLALAYLGEKAEAIREGERGVALRPITADGFNAPYFQHQLVRIYLLVGEPEKALDRLEPLLKIPYYLSPAWLGIDPAFTELRGNPRFRRLREREPEERSGPRSGATRASSD